MILGMKTRNFHSIGNKSQSVLRLRIQLGSLIWLAVAGAGSTPGPAQAEDPGVRAVQQQLLERQQQQEALQLRMRQQRSSPARPADPRETQLLEQAQAGERQRQQELHYRQSIEPSTAQPGDDEGTRRAKADQALRKAQRDGERELQASPEKRREKD